MMDKFNVGDQTSDLFATLGNNPKDVQSYFVYTYHFLDDRSFIPRASEKLRYYSDGYTYISEVEELFKNHGWDGDGEIGLIWLPPFVGLEVEDTYGILCFHVKQTDNGTSWIASPAPLQFKSHSLNLEE